MAKLNNIWLTWENLNSTFLCVIGMHYIRSFDMYFILYRTFASFNIQNECRMVQIQCYANNHASDITLHINSWFISWNSEPTYQWCARISGCWAGNNILTPLDPSVLSYRANYFWGFLISRAHIHAVHCIHSLPTTKRVHTQQVSSKVIVKVFIDLIFPVANNVTLFYFHIRKLPP